MLLASSLDAKRPLHAAVALLTVANVFPKSWAQRQAVAGAVLEDGNTIDELATALLAWVEQGRHGSWILSALQDPTAAQRHAARRGDYLMVGQVDDWRLAGITAMCNRIAAERAHA